MRPYLLDEQGKSDPQWLALVERFPQRFMLGSDVVGPVRQPARVDGELRSVPSTPASSRSLARWRGTTSWRCCRASPPIREANNPDSSSVCHAGVIGSRQSHPGVSQSFIRSCISRSVFLLGAGVAVAAQAEVRIDGPIEYGVFEIR